MSSDATWIKSKNSWCDPLDPATLLCDLCQCILRKSRLGDEQQLRCREVAVLRDPALDPLNRRRAPVFDDLDRSDHAFAIEVAFNYDINLAIFAGHGVPKHFGLGDGDARCGEVCTHEGDDRLEPRSAPRLYFKPMSEDGRSTAPRCDRAPPWCGSGELWAPATRPGATAGPEADVRRHAHGATPSTSRGGVTLRGACTGVHEAPD